MSRTSMEPVNLVVTLQQDARANYVRALGAMYASVRTHTQAALKLFIVHDDSLTAESISILSEFVGRTDSISFINVGAFPQFMSVVKQYEAGRFSAAVVWRVFLPDMLADVDKVIMLDADLILLFDILTLWNVDLSESSIAASLRHKPWSDEYHRLVRTPPGRYFRMGFSVLNLKRMRANTEFMSEREDFLIYKLPEIDKVTKLNEQSLFNYFFSGSCTHLDVNLCPAANFNVEEPKEIEAMLRRVGTMRNVVLDLKGWEHRSPFDYFYWSYLLLTPWREEAYNAMVTHQRSGRAGPSAANAV